MVNGECRPLRPVLNLHGHNFGHAHNAVQIRVGESGPESLAVSKRGYVTYGGEGGIRTPDSLTTMPDFESGAFNRALPPLRSHVSPKAGHSLRVGWGQSASPTLASLLAEAPPLQR